MIDGAGQLCGVQSQALSMPASDFRSAFPDASVADAGGEVDISCASHVSAITRLLQRAGVEYGVHS